MLLFLENHYEYPNKKSIIHRVPIAGYSYLPNDKDFALFEKAKKKKDVICTVAQ